MKFSVKDFFSKCDQIRRNLRVWSHLLKTSLMENFIFCVVNAESLKGLKKENRNISLCEEFNVLHPNVILDLQ